MAAGPPRRGMRRLSAAAATPLSQPPLPDLSPETLSPPARPGSARPWRRVGHRACFGAPPRTTGRDPRVSAWHRLTRATRRGALVMPVSKRIKAAFREKRWPLKVRAGRAADKRFMQHWARDCRRIQVGVPMAGLGPRLDPTRIPGRGQPATATGAPRASPDPLGPAPRPAPADSLQVRGPPSES